MSWRAPKRERELDPPSEVVQISGYWIRSKWWQAVKDGEMLCETSTPNSDLAFQAALNDGATARQRVDFVPTECRWEEREPDVRHLPQKLYDTMPEHAPGTTYYIRDEWAQ